MNSDDKSKDLELSAEAKLLLAEYVDVRLRAYATWFGVVNVVFLVSGLVYILFFLPGTAVRTAIESSKEIYELPNMMIRELSVSALQEISVLRGNSAKLRGDMSTLTNDSTKLSGDIKKLTNDSTKLSGDIKKLTNDSTKLSGDIKKLRQKQTDITQLYEALETQASKTDLEFVSSVLKEIEKYADAADRLSRLQQAERTIEVHGKILKEHGYRLGLITDSLDQQRAILQYLTASKEPMSPD